MRQMLVAIGALLVLPGSAASEGLESIFSGSEVRRTTGPGGEVRWDVWTLGADGSISGNYLVEIGALALGAYPEEGQVDGRWWVQGDTLCIEASGLDVGGTNCYKVESTGREGGGERYSASNVTGGETWEMLVYRTAADPE